MKILPRHKLLLLASFAFSVAGIQAQTDADLLRYSMTNPIGTSRYNAMGGAFGSLGANFSALSTNPAGIGFFTRHELSFTMGPAYSNATSNYYGQESYLDNTQFTVPQMGGVFEVYRGPQGKGIRRLQFGVGANRLKDFNSSWYSQAVNPQSSYMNYVEAVSQGYDFSTEYGQGIAHPGNLAYQTGLMDFADTVGLDYITFLGSGLDQRHVLRESGNITETTISFGGNWADMLYFGATLGIPFVDYRQESIIEERNPGLPGEPVRLPNQPEEVTYFNSYELTQDLQVRGNGLNLKLGLIFRPLHLFRVGIAFHTPTYYWLKETSTVSLNTDMQYIYNGSQLPNHAKYEYRNYRYNIVTPAKGILSVAFLIKNFGAVSVEGELTDYRTMRIETDDIDLKSSLRETVRENYRMAGVLRAGTEWKVGIVSLRAGYIYQSSPYKNPELDRQWYDHTATVGLGLALGLCNLDFAFMANYGGRTDDFYYLEDQQGQPLVIPAKVNFAKYVFTAGASFRF